MKIKTKLKACFVCILSVATGTYAGITSQITTSAANPQDITFTVNVRESLSVTLSTTTPAATGNPNGFLNNSFNLTVATNNSTGFVASMYSETKTLNNGSNTIPSITASANKSTFASTNLNKWGYSLDNTTYNPIKLSTETPALIASSSSATTSKTATVYFGTQVNTAIPAGAYTNNVTVNVVTPYAATPSVPAANTTNTPSQDTNTTDRNATPVSSTNSSVFVNPSVAGQTQIISGSYTGPLGASESTSYTTTSEVAGGSSLATGLAVAAATAAVSGGVFFALSKFRSRDDDDF